MGENPEGQSQLEDLGLIGGIILKVILKKYVGKGVGWVNWG
jgi:hypothetical protein